MKMTNLLVLRARKVNQARLLMLSDQKDQEALWAPQVSREPEEKPELKVTREILAPGDGMVSLVPQETLGHPAHQDPMDHQVLEGTLLLRWLVDLMRSLEVLRWE